MGSKTCSCMWASGGADVLMGRTCILRWRTLRLNLRTGAVIVIDSERCKRK